MPNFINRELAEEIFIDQPVIKEGQDKLQFDRAEINLFMFGNPENIHAINTLVESSGLTHKDLAECFIDKVDVNTLKWMMEDAPFIKSLVTVHKVPFEDIMILAQERPYELGNLLMNKAEMGKSEKYANPNFKGKISLNDIRDVGENRANQFKEILASQDGGKKTFEEKEKAKAEKGKESGCSIS